MTQDKTGRAWQETSHTVNFPLFTHCATDEVSAYVARSKPVGELSTDPQKSSQQQGDISIGNAGVKNSRCEFVVVMIVDENVWREGGARNQNENLGALNGDLTHYPQPEIVVGTSNLLEKRVEYGSS